MVTVKVNNTLTEGNIIVKVGNAGIFAHLTTLRPGDTYKLRIDQNATYREYVLFALPNNEKLPTISSDEILDYKEIRIYKKLHNGNEEVAWRGIREREEKKVTPAENPDLSDKPCPSNPGDGEDSTVNDATKKSGNLLQRLWNKFPFAHKSPAKENYKAPAEDAAENNSDDPAKPSVSYK